MSANFLDKQPSEVFTIDVNYLARLAVGETVISKIVIVTEVLTGSDVTTAIVKISAIITPKVYITLQGGTDGMDYKITVKATTNSNNVLEEEVIMHVREE